MLTASGVLAKTVDFVFRAFYSRQLGSEGMGIFSLCFAVHSIMLNIASGGLGVAVSKSVSECYSSGHTGEISRTMKAALGMVFVLSLVSVSVVCVFSKTIATEVLKEPRCSMSLACIAPTVLFMGISYCIKGYFYATRRVIIPASSEFLEQLVKIVTTTFLLFKMLPRGVEYGCAAVFLGMTVGEFSSCLYLFLFYASAAQKCGSKEKKSAPALPRLLKISLPIMATSLVCSFFRMHEEVLTLDSLEKSGLSKNQALSTYGGIRGMVMPLIVFPLTLLSSCFTLLVPEISRAYAMKNKVRLQTLVSKLYRFCAIFGFLVLCVFWVFGDSLALLVYNTNDISVPLKILAVISPLMFVDSVSTGILNGMGKQTRLLAFCLLDSASRVLMIYLLTPRFGISALVLTIIFSNALTVCLTYKSVIGISGIGIKSSGRIWRYIAATAFAAILAKKFLPHFEGTNEMIFGIGILMLIYFVFSFLFGAAKKSDFRWLLGRMFF